MKSRALKLSENVWHDMFILKLYGANPNFKLQARKEVLKMKVQEKVAHLKLASEHLVFV